MAVLLEKKRFYVDHKTASILKQCDTNSIDLEKKVSDNTSIRENNEETFCKIAVPLKTYPRKTASTLRQDNRNLVNINLEKRDSNKAQTMHYGQCNPQLYNEQIQSSSYHHEPATYSLTFTRPVGADKDGLQKERNPNISISSSPHSSVTGYNSSVITFDTVEMFFHAKGKATYQEGWHFRNGDNTAIIRATDYHPRNPCNGFCLKHLDNHRCLLDGYNLDGLYSFFKSCVLINIQSCYLGFEIENDELLLHYGTVLFSQDCENPHIIMRLICLARLLLAVRDLHGTASMNDCIDPAMYATVITAVKTVANSNTRSSKFRNQDTATSLFESLKQLAEIVKFNAALYESRTKATEFLQVLATHWSDFLPENGRTIQKNVEHETCAETSAPIPPPKTIDAFIPKKSAKRKAKTWFPAKMSHV